MTLYKFIIIITFTIVTNDKCLCQQNDTLRYIDQGDIIRSQKKIVTVLPNDTIYFCISIKKHKAFVRLKGKWTQLSLGKQLSNFIKENRSRIDKNKIIVISPAKTKFRDFNYVLDALKDNDVTEFHLADTD